MNLITTQEASRLLTELGRPILDNEIARLASLGVFNGAQKTNNRWLIPQEEIVLFALPPGLVGENDRLMNLTQAASILGISVSQTRSLAKFGYLATPKVVNGEIIAIPLSSAFALRNSGLNLTHLPSFGSKAQYWIKHNKLRSTIGTLVAFLALLFAMVSAGSDLGGFRNQAINWGLINAFAVAKPEEKLIVISSIYNSEGIPDTEIHLEIKSALEEVIQQLGIKNVRVEIDPRKVQDADRRKIEEISNQYNAAIMIWGQDTGIKLTINVWVADGSNSIDTEEFSLTETQNAQLTNPEGYASFVLEPLPRNIAFVALFISGQVSFINGEISEATGVIENAIRTIETNPGSLNNLAYAYKALGNVLESSDQYLEALNFYNLALDLTSDAELRQDLYSRLGSASCTIEDWENCLYYLLESRVSNMEDYQEAESAAYHIRGFYRIIAEDYPGAIEDLSRAIEAGGVHPGDHYYLRASASYYYAEDFAKTGDFDKALDLYSSAIEDFEIAFSGLVETEFEPSSTYYSSYGQRGWVNYLLSNFVSSIADFSKAIDFVPDFPGSYYGRACARLGLGRTNEALLDLKRAAELSPPNALMLDTATAVAIVVGGDPEIKIACDHSWLNKTNP